MSPYTWTLRQIPLQEICESYIRINIVLFSMSEKLTLTKKCIFAVIFQGRLRYWLCFFFLYSSWPDAGLQYLIPVMMFSCQSVCQESEWQTRSGPVLSSLSLLMCVPQPAPYKDGSGEMCCGTGKTGFPLKFYTISNIIMKYLQKKCFPVLNKAWLDTG